MCCSVLRQQSVFQCVETSELEAVAVCCSVLQCDRASELEVKIQS